jgi:RHS repeat-associated protein
MKEKHSTLRAGATLVLALLWTAASASAADVPGANSGSVSSVSDSDAKALQSSTRVKHNTELFTGSFSYSIPVEGAPARNGSEPSLSLNYSSSGENGWCGVGWNLDIGYIERNSKDNGVPVLWDTSSPPKPVMQYDDSKGFVFNLFGKQGKLKPVGGQEYRAEVEELFLRFTFDSANNRWDIYDKSGNHYVFGQRAASRMANSATGWSSSLANGTFRWALDEIDTVTGDQTTISYKTYDSAKPLYPDTISYNGHVPYNNFGGSLAPTHTIQFITESRNDRRFSYRSAFRVETTQRLKQIVCKVGTQPVRRYDLTYDYSPSTKASLLKTVQTFGNDNASPLPPETFTYTEKPLQFEPALRDWGGMDVPDYNDPAWTTMSGHSSALTGSHLVSDLIDIDGDGLPDRIRLDAAGPGIGPPWDNFRVQKNLGIQPNGSGAFGSLTGWGITSQGNGHNMLLDWSAINGGYTRFLDIDGDGRPDRVMDNWDYVHSGAPYDRFAVERNTGSGFSPGSWLNVDIQGARDTANTAYFTAIEYTLTGPGVMPQTKTKLIDIDGDGIPDRVMLKRDPAIGPWEYFSVQTGTGNAAFNNVKLYGKYASQGKQNSPDSWASIETPWVKFIDINGDGLPDRVMVPVATTNPNDSSRLQGSATWNKFVVEFNNGYSFEQGDWPGVDPQFNVTPPGSTVAGTTYQYTEVENLPYVGLFDINGDHLPDRVMTDYHDHTQWLVQINNGSGFEPAQPFLNVLRGATPDPNDASWYGISGANTEGQPLSSLSDMNGDGLVDRVLADYDTLNHTLDKNGNPIPPFPGFRVNLNQGPVPDLMKTADNGMGGTVSIQYQPSTVWNNRKNPTDPLSAGMLAFPVQTVTSVTTSDGINPSRTTSYGYSGGFFDPSRKEFAGFACVTNTDPSGRKEVYYFHQGGGRDNPSGGEYQDNGSFAKKGMAYRIESYGNNTPIPLLYKVVVNQINQTDLSNGRWFPFICQTFDFDYPGGGTPKVTATRFDYQTALPSTTDPTGNLIKKTMYGEVSIPDLTTLNPPSDVDPSDTRYQQIIYDPASIPNNINIKDHPQSVTLTSDDVGTQVIQETTYTYYDYNGRVKTVGKRMCSGQYSTETYAYDPSYGNRSLTIDPVGVETKVDSFDTYQIYPTATRKRVTAGTDTAGPTGDHITSTAYDVRSGLATSVTDPMGVNIATTYDAFFRPLVVNKTPVAVGGVPGTTFWVKQFSYNLDIASAGTARSYVHVKSVDGVDLSNGTESRVYVDGLGRPVQSRTEGEDGHYRVSTTVYDERGEAFLTTWPRLETGVTFTPPTTQPATFTIFDEAGRISQVYSRVDATFVNGVYDHEAPNYGDGPSLSPLAPKKWAYVFNGDPWWILCTDEDQKVRRFHLDAFGQTNRIEEVYDANTTYATTLNYDLAGNLTEIDNQNGEHIDYGYDDAGNLVAMADPHLGVWTYRHDLAGRVREQIDGKGQKITFDYKASLGRLSAKKVFDAANNLLSTATYTYDIGDANYTVYKGMLFQVTDSEGWEKTGYDPLGRENKSTRHLEVTVRNKTVKSQDYTATYTYDNADHLTSTVYPNSSPTITINYEYHPGGSLKRVYRSGYDFYNTAAANFDEFDHLTQYTYGNGIVNNRNYYPISKRLQSISTSTPVIPVKNYSYTAADDVTGISGTTITYDNLHRVQNYSGRGNYTYDPVGNITANPEAPNPPYNYDYGAARKQAVKSAFGKTYLYDLCGNMIVRRGDTTGSQSLEYDGENRLARFCQAGTLVVEYGYAASGQRLWKWKNQTDLQVWIGNIYEEKDGKTLYHVFAGGQRICTFEPGSVLAGGTGGASTHVGYYYHEDILNSSSALSDSAGQLMEANVWYPFGRTQTASPQAPFQVSSKFTGQTLDAETGLYYYGARYYDPELGRFIQPDKIISDISNPQSYNRYSYVLNNPLKYTDPDGRSAWGAVQNAAYYAGNFVVGSVVEVGLSQTRIAPPVSVAGYNGRLAGRNTATAFGLFLMGKGMFDMKAGTGMIAVGAATELESGGTSSSAVAAGEGTAAVGAGETLVGGLFVLNSAKLRPLSPPLANYSSGNSAGNKNKVPTPSLKDSPFGPKVEDPVPKNGVPQNWTKEQIGEAITDYETSLASRKAEQSAFGATGKGNETQRLAHARRITEEENFLKSLIKAQESRR